jgi:hypothetical protein
MFNTASEKVAKTQLNISHLVHILDDFAMAASYQQCCIIIDECQSVGPHSQEFN